MDTERLLDVLVNGPAHATTPDPRDRIELVSAVCAEIAHGADVTDACAACAVAPGEFLAWTVDDDATGTAYARALRIRARLLADAPIAAARVIRDARVGGERGQSLVSLVAAVKAEAELASDVAEKGEPRPRGGGSGADPAENVVRIVFDPLPVHHQVTPADTQSVAPRDDVRALSASVPADYVVIRSDDRSA